MEQGRLISGQKKVKFQVTDLERISGIDKPEEQILNFLEKEEKRNKGTGEDENLFLNYTRIDSSSLLEERFRLNILKIFIEYFCIKQRIPLKELIGSIERAILVRTLSYFEGNQRNAAKFLGLKYTTFNEKIKKYNIRILKKIC